MPFKKRRPRGEKRVTFVGHDEESVEKVQETFEETRRAQKRRKKLRERVVAKKSSAALQRAKGKAGQEKEEDETDKFKASGDRLQQRVAELKGDFISRRLETKRRELGGDTAEAEVPSPAAPKLPVEKKSVASMLYSVPKEMRDNSLIDKEHGDRWLAGIVEVEVPVKDNMSCIAELEKVKRQLLHGRMEDETLADPGYSPLRHCFLSPHSMLSTHARTHRLAAANLNTNYSVHHRDSLRVLTEQRQLRTAMVTKVLQEESRASAPKAAGAVIPPVAPVTQRDAFQSNDFGNDAELQRALDMMIDR
ncbi:MAG: hypothetical protein MHM6MM_006325 [Cercozoa sp. M6MM]